MKAIIGKAARRKWAWILALVMTVSIIIPTSLLTVKAEKLGTLEITEVSGKSEAAYVEWTTVKNAAKFEVTVTGNGKTTKLDDQLIREYKDGHWRADAVGLAAGEYTFTVSVANDDASDKTSVTTDKVVVVNYDRTGFGWVNGTSSGAYNEDGTLKDNAIVLYLTEETKDTMTLDVVTSKNGATTLGTGIVEILSLYKKGYDKRPLDIRIVGTVSNLGQINSDKDCKGDIVITGSSDSKRLSTGVTVEGIGEDAVALGWGLRLKNVSNAEVRNIGYMLCDSDEGDDVGLQQGNDHIWVHNCDMFYGNAGGDADQAKGDGALDCKKSTYVTFSYNHFWDNGKCNLLGLSEGTTEGLYITYHHNWYDHSDSRHPRVRYYSAHVYNNYYDGNAKYGAGSTLGSSVFVESNYFRNCPYPMLTSMQGSDVFAGGTDRDVANKATFSKEAGGTIKAFGNILTGSYTFIPYGSSTYTLKGVETAYNLNGTTSTQDFDAVVVSSADEKIGSDVKSYTGSNTYNNFDTSDIMYSYKADKAEDVPAIVTANAGRMNGGDFKWTFNNDVDDASYAVNAELKKALQNYESQIKLIGGSVGKNNTTGEGESSTKASEAETKATEATTKETEATTKNNETTKAEESTKETTAPSTSSSHVHNFTTDGVTSRFFTISGSMNNSSNKKSVSYNGLTLTESLKFDSNAKITFTCDSDAELVLVFASDFAKCIKIDGKKNSTKAANGILKLTVAKGTHTITKNDGTLLYYMSVTTAGSTETTKAEETTKATEATTKATETTTKETEATTKAIEATTKETETPSVPSEAGEYDSKSLSYSGAYTDISTKKDSEFKNAKYVSTSEEIRAAIDNAKAGDVIIIKEGTYKFDSIESLMAKDDKGKTGAPALYITNNGVADNYIILKAEYGKSVKFDFSSQKLASFNRGLIHYADYWYFEGINFYHAGDNGVLLSGNNNIFEKCVFEANRDTGLQIARKDANAQPTKDTWPSNNLIINCTSFNNVDPVDEGGNGENADGFAAKLTCGEGNVFDGCISYCNSDDGWDLYAKPATGSIGVVTIRNCIAYGNGKLSDGSGEAAGDMNGFKLGGSNGKVPTPHVVLNCIALNNGACGFTDNGNGGALTIMNCTSVANGKYAKKSNFTFYRSSSDSMYMGLVSVDDTDSDKFVGKMLNSIYFNSKKYYRISGMIPTVMANGNKKGDVVSNPSGISGMFISTNNTIDTNKSLDSQIRNADGTINVKGLYETTGEYATMGAHFGAANQIIKVSVNTNVKEDETKTEETSSSQETTKATETTTKETQAPTKATEATTKETQAPTKATEATTKETQAPTRATEATTKETQAPTEATTEAAGQKLILNANNMKAETIKSSIYADGFKINASSDDGTVTVDGNTKSYNGKSFKQRIKLGGAGTTAKRSIEFKTAGASTVTVYAISSTKDKERKLQLIDKNGKTVATSATIGGTSLVTVTFNIKEAGEYYIASTSGGINVYYVEVSNGIALTGSTEAPTTEPTQAPTEAPTTKPTQAPTEAPTEEPTTQAPTEAPTTKPTQAPTVAPTTESTQAATEQETTKTAGSTTAPTQAPTVKPSQADSTVSADVKKPEVGADEEKITNSQVETVSSDTAASAKTPEVAADETKTGDASHMMMYVIIFISALAVFAGSAVVSKRRRVK